VVGVRHVERASAVGPDIRLLMSDNRSLMLA
jgi:hypothetical protein